MRSATPQNSAFAAPASSAAARSGSDQTLLRADEVGWMRFAGKPAPSGGRAGSGPRRRPRPSSVADLEQDRRLRIEPSRGDPPLVALTGAEKTAMIAFGTGTRSASRTRRTRRRGRRRASSRCEHRQPLRVDPAASRPSRPDDERGGVGLVVRGLVTRVDDHASPRLTRWSIQGRWFSASPPLGRPGRGSRRRRPSACRRAGRPRRRSRPCRSGRSRWPCPGARAAGSRPSAARAASRTAGRGAAHVCLRRRDASRAVRQAASSRRAKTRSTASFSGPS